MDEKLYKRAFRVSFDYLMAHLDRPAPDDADGWEKYWAKACGDLSRAYEDGVPLLDKMLLLMFTELERTAPERPPA